MSGPDRASSRFPPVTGSVSRTARSFFTGTVTVSCSVVTYLRSRARPASCEVVPTSNEPLPEPWTAAEGPWGAGPQGLGQTDWQLAVDSAAGPEAQPRATAPVSTLERTLFDDALADAEPEAPLEEALGRRVPSWGGEVAA